MTAKSAIEQLENLDLQQLEELKKACDARIVTLRKTARQDLKRHLHETAQAQGFSIEELFGSSKKTTKPKGSKIPPKYKNPNNSDQLWSGRGKRPAWVSAHLDKGGELKDLAI